MFNRNLNVYHCRRLSDDDYFCDDELRSRQPLPGEKVPSSGRKANGSPRPASCSRWTGKTAQEYRVAAAVVENFSQFKQHYGLESDPALVEPGWVDALAHFLHNQSMQAVLIFLGALGIYIGCTRRAPASAPSSPSWPSPSFSGAVSFKAPPAGWK